MVKTHTANQLTSNNTAAVILLNLHVDQHVHLKIHHGFISGHALSHLFAAELVQGRVWKRCQLKRLTAGLAARGL